MRVAVGSENPVKVAATEAAIGDLPGATVDAVAVDSGVAEQPNGPLARESGKAQRALLNSRTGRSRPVRQESPKVSPNRRAGLWPASREEPKAPI